MKRKFCLCDQMIASLQQKIQEMQAQLKDLRLYFILF